MENPDTAPMKERIGIFDIETTGLLANWGIMASWCILDHDTGEIVEDLITRREIRDRRDHRIVKSATEEIKRYDRIMTWYGTRFDIPFVRTKAIKMGYDFPKYRDLYHTDLLYISRSKLRLHSNRLEAVCEYFEIPAKHHKMTPKLNNDLQAGKQYALDDVLEHCREDVWSTNEVFKMFRNHMMMAKRSV